MELSEINASAKRQVVKTSRFANLLKKGSCKVEQRTKGDTKHTVIGMRDFVYKHLPQTKKLAQALAAHNLQDTIANNFNYLYTHYQYNADDLLQVMRSPECAFADRFNGIDCKTFSILSSSILINQGYKNIIRRVKQPSFNPDYYTHVYVIVPKDQETMNLQNGYYVLDATTHNNRETLFNEKHDTIMSQLPHVWLNGAAPEKTISSASQGFTKLLQHLLNKGVNNIVIEEIQETINTYIKKGVDPSVLINNTSITIQDHTIDLALNADSGMTLNVFFSDFATVTTGLNGAFDSLDGLFSNIDFSDISGSLSCFGGSYDNKDFENFSKLLGEGYTTLVNNFNAAVVSQNFAQIGATASLIFRQAQQLEANTNRAASKNWSSSCSAKATKGMQTVAVYFQKMITEAFKPYLATYFDYTDTNTPFNGALVFSSRGDSKGLSSGYRLDVVYSEITNVSFKTGISAIPKFEFTPYLLTNAESNGFDLNSFLNDLGNIAVQFTGNSNGNTTGTETVPGSGVVTVPGTNPPQPSEAGFGLVEGVITLGILGTIAYKYAQSKNKKDAK